MNMPVVGFRAGPAAVILHVTRTVSPAACHAHPAYVEDAQLQLFIALSLDAIRDQEGKQRFKSLPWWHSAEKFVR